MTEKATIGEILRQHREERGLTPEQAAYQSKVPLRLLQALEADDYRMLPDAAYLLRFLHDYARLLKLDPDALKQEFHRTIHRPPGQSLAPAPPPPPPPIPWKHVAWTGAAILVVTPLVFIMLSLVSKRSAERAPAPPAVERPSEEPGPVPDSSRLTPDRPVATLSDTVRSDSGDIPAGLREIPLGPADIAQGPPV